MPKLKLVKSRRSPAREALAERIAAAKEAERDLDEARRAAEKAREQLREIEAERDRLTKDQPLTADDRIAAMASGALDARGQSKASAARSRRIAELETAHDNLVDVRALTERAIYDRTRNLDYARKAVEAAARVVVCEVVDMDDVAGRIEKSKAALESALLEAASIYAISPHGSKIGERARRLITKATQFDERFEGSREHAPLRRLLAALSSDPDATL